MKPIAFMVLAYLGGILGPTSQGADGAAEPYWAGEMRQVHAKHRGTPGTLALFGDSITVSLAFWAPLAWEARNLDSSADKAHRLVKSRIKPECWNKWRGPQFGNEGRMTIRWAHENVDRWLERLNPEVAVIMFGSNDLGQMGVGEYEEKYRTVIQKCLVNGTVVIVTTMPPRSGQLEKSRQFADASRKLAAELKVPLIDYFGEILERRPADWDGALPQFKDTPGDVYQVPTLISRDGVHPSNPKAHVSDYSAEGLRRSGFTLRSYLTLLAYAQVIEQALEPRKQ